MKYLSSRDPDSKLFSFEHCLFQGLAPDGGLFLPEKMPKLSLEKLFQKDDLKFPDLAANILSNFISKDEIDYDDLLKICYKSFEVFRIDSVVRLVDVSSNKSDNNKDDFKNKQKLFVLELFHGPTFAFKDIALQFLGNLFEYFINKSQAINKLDKKLLIIGATSGDTGSAAIAGLRNKQNIKVVILYPKHRISYIQEVQMTSVLDENINCLSLENSNFDECQRIVKNIFTNKAEILNQNTNSQYQIGAINSINIARILMQTVYYFMAYYQFHKKLKTKINKDRDENIFNVEEKIIFSVPSGNFGNALAGYYSYLMGLPIKKIIVATNKNDILDQFFRTGNYVLKRENALETYSPAMDILVSSNFERLLWHIHYYSNDPSKLDETDAIHFCRKKASKIVEEQMNAFKLNKFIKLEPHQVEYVKDIFESYSVDDETTSETINRYYKSPNKYLIDPHTSVGLKAAERYIKENNSAKYVISLCTAHPGKFIETIKKAIGDDQDIKGKNIENCTLKSEVPEDLSKLFDKNIEKKFYNINSQDPEREVFQFIRNKVLIN